MVLLQRDVRDTADPAAMWTAVLPVATWCAVLQSRRARLRVEASSAPVRVMARSGTAEKVLESAHVQGVWEVDLTLPEVTWVWVDGDVDVVEWEVAEEPPLPRVTAVVPTFGRPAEAASQTHALLAADVVGHVVVVDQGGGLADDVAFVRLCEREPERVLLVSQDNVGGSGGYARGMLEALRWPEDAIFLGDDDALIDGESLRRMVVLQALSAARGDRCIVGTGMRSAEHPEQLISLSERVEPRRFWWGPADGLRAPLDLSRWPEGWDELIPVHEPDYAGWWGALLPPTAVADVGLPAPYFLKWDDAEYGLRARRRGYRVRTLPGAAVRHPTWGAKGTAASWASSPMHRNRLATAAAYGAGRGVLLDSFLHQVKHVLSLQYTAADLWQHGASQALAGPRDWLGTDLRRVRPEAQRVIDEAPAPQIAQGAEAPDERGASLLRAVVGLWRPVPTKTNARRVSANDLSWRTTLGADHVRVENPDGEPTAVLHRDPRRARRLLRDVVVLHLRLALRWSRLRREYRRALPRTWTSSYWLQELGLSGAETCTGTPR